MKFRSQKPKGLTLVELLLTVSLTTIIAGTMGPSYISYLYASELDTAVATTARAAKRAQALSQAIKENSTWGIYAQKGSITVFKGTDFASREVIYDEANPIPDAVKISGLSQIVYSKLYGEPGTSGNINFTGRNNKTRTLSINSKGTVNY